MTGLAQYTIRRADFGDLPLLSSWRAQEHVRRWWGPPGVEPESEKLGESCVACWIGELDGKPLAFIQDYAVSDWPPHHFDYLPAGARGLDLYVGDPNALGLGHGHRLLRLHVDRMFDHGVPAVGIDPHPDNPRAIRSFEKAGFAIAVGPVTTRWGRAILMDRYAKSDSRGGSAARR